MTNAIGAMIALALVIFGLMVGDIGPGLKAIAKAIDDHSKRMKYGE